MTVTKIFHELRLGKKSIFLWITVLRKAFLSPCRYQKPVLTQPSIWDFQISCYVWKILNSLNKRLWQLSPVISRPQWAPLRGCQSSLWVSAGQWRAHVHPSSCGSDWTTRDSAVKSPDLGVPMRGLALRSGGYQARRFCYEEHWQPQGESLALTRPQPSFSTCTCRGGPVAPGGRWGLDNSRWKGCNTWSSWPTSESKSIKRWRSGLPGWKGAPRSSWGETSRRQTPRQPGAAWPTFACAFFSGWHAELLWCHQWHCGATTGEPLWCRKWWWWGVAACKAVWRSGDRCTASRHLMVLGSLGHTSFAPFLCWWGEVMTG